MERCAVVMPVYNEAGCIERICQEWLAEVEPLGHGLIVVDDGSTDGTFPVLGRMAAASPALRIIRQTNGGHGSAILRGYREAVTIGCEWVFQTDSDGEISAADYGALWSQRHRSNFILAARQGRADPMYRLALSRIHSLLVNAAFEVTLVDPNVPFRLMRADLLGELLRFIPAGTFAPNVFLAVLASRSGEPPLSIPVRHNPRAAGESTLRPARMAKLCALCLRQAVQFRLREFRNFAAKGVAKPLARTRTTTTS